MPLLPASRRPCLEQCHDFRLSKINGEYFCVEKTGRPFDQPVHVQLGVAQHHHAGRIVDARRDLSGLSALLAASRPVPLLQPAVARHYTALSRHRGIAPVRHFYTLPLKLSTLGS